MDGVLRVRVLRGVRRLHQHSRARALHPQKRYDTLQYNPIHFPPTARPAAVQLHREYQSSASMLSDNRVGALKRWILTFTEMHSLPLLTQRMPMLHPDPYDRHVPPQGRYLREAYYPPNTICLCAAQEGCQAPVGHQLRILLYATAGAHLRAPLARAATGCCHEVRFALPRLHIHHVPFIKFTCDEKLKPDTTLHLLSTTGFLCPPM